MRVFVGYGYNERDAWIESHFFPILRASGFAVVDGRDLYGEVLSDAVKRRLDRSDAAIGFLTVREGQGDADFTSHMWVRDELSYALNVRQIPIIPVREVGVKVPDGLLGNLAYVPLDPADRLDCVAKVMAALGTKYMRRVRLEPENEALRVSLGQWRNDPAFKIRYHTRFDNGEESAYRQEGRLEVDDGAFILNVSEFPHKAQIEIEGLLNGKVCFWSGWRSSSSAVPVKITAA